MMIRKRPTRQETGSILVMTALVLTVLLAITALAIDAAFMYDERNHMAAAADAAALAGAREMKRSPTANLQTFANYEVAVHGLPAGDTSVAVHRPPTSGSFIGNTKYVEVLVSRPVSTFFARLFGRNTMTVGARAVAGLGAAEPSNFTVFGCSTVPACEASPNLNHAMTLTGGSSVTVNGTIDINSSDAVALQVGSGGNLTAPDINVNGNYTCGGTCSTIDTGQPRVPDPLAGQPDPSCAGCSIQTTMIYHSVGTAGTPIIIPHGIYPKSSGNTLKIDGDSQVKFEAGVYILKGVKLSISGSGTVATSATAEQGGVTFFITCENYPNCNTSPGTWGSISFGSGATVALQAPNGGDNAGILFFQDRLDTQEVAINGGSTLNLQGVIYAKSAWVDFDGGSGTGGDALYTVIITNKLDIGGGGVFHSDYTNLTSGVFAPNIPSLSE
jgi:hypothetical protein